MLYWWWFVGLALVFMVAVGMLVLPLPAGTPTCRCVRPPPCHGIACKRSGCLLNGAARRRIGMAPSLLTAPAAGRAVGRLTALDPCAPDPATPPQAGWCASSWPRRCARRALSWRPLCSCWPLATLSHTPTRQLAATAAWMWKQPAAPAPTAQLPRPALCQGWRQSSYRCRRLFRRQTAWTSSGSQTSLLPSPLLRRRCRLRCSAGCGACCTVAALPCPGSPRSGRCELRRCAPPSGRQRREPWASTRTCTKPWSRSTQCRGPPPPACRWAAQAAAERRCRVKRATTSAASLAAWESQPCTVPVEACLAAVPQRLIGARAAPDLRAPAPLLPPCRPRLRTHDLRTLSWMCTVRRGASQPWASTACCSSRARCCRPP